MTTGTIRLSYGNFTCSFDRIAEEDAFTRAIISQIAEIVSRNPSFGSLESSGATSPVPPTPPGPTDFTHFRASATAPKTGQNPMRLENPVVGPVAVSVSEVAELNARDFDSAHNEAPVSFMRSSQIKTSQEAMSGNPELLEKYEALRAAVTRMLNETNVGITPIQKQAPTIQPHAAQVHSIAESEPVSVSQQGSTLRIFPMPR